VDSLVQTIDLSGWFTGEAEGRRAVVDAIDREYCRVGFLRVSGHGLAGELIEDMIEVTTAFFDLPEDHKLRYVPRDKAVNRGYAAYGTEALAYSLGLDSKPDMFEAFNCGVDAVDESDPYVAAERHRFFAPNRWPEQPADMRAVWVAYFDACQALAGELSRMFAVALGMPEDFIFDKVNRAACVMRANNYERRSHHADPEPGQVRMGAHTDYGVCTILLADPVPGLQIVGPDGTWRDVLPEQGTLLVNLGDLLAEWTNDRWRSTLHRVVPPVGSGPARRRSVAFFQEANYDALVSVMPTCVSADNPARYTPVIAGEHLMNKLIGPRTLQRSTAAQTSAVRKFAGDEVDNG
jgi:isopenicillin N synthase-like dioxygenase